MSRTTFKALRDPSLDFVLEILKNQHSVQQLMISQQIDDVDIPIIFGNEKWAPFLNDVVCAIKTCLPTTKGQKLKHLEKKLCHKIRKITRDFSKLNGSEFNILLNCKDEFLLKGHWISFWNVMAKNFVRIVRKEMCNGISEGIGKINKVIDKCFTVNFGSLNIGILEKQFYQEKVYMLAGYLIHAMKKASKRFQESRRDVFVEFVRNIQIDHETAITHDLPCGEVKRIDRFKGLKYCNTPFYEFVMRLESVFIELLHPEYLVMVGSDLISNVYESLSKNKGLRAMISSILVNRDCEDENVLIITKYITRTYCRLRGKDFSRKIMSRDTKSNMETIRQKTRIITQHTLYSNNDEKNNESEQLAVNENENIINVVTTDDVSDNFVYQVLIHNSNTLGEEFGEMETILLE